VKAPTGIAGFDGITGGGLAHGRSTLLVGGPGAGKTALALQFPAHGARHCGEPGIFVAFEEASTRMRRPRRLRVLGCDEMRGFLFSKPVPVELFETKVLAPPAAG
jgi:KaiC/GvpD/RAD55 family RecA-like ATPase